MSQNSTAPAYSVANSFAYATPGQILATAAALPAISILVVAARLYARTGKKVKIGIDDYLIIPALLLIIGMGVTIIIGVKAEAVGYATPPPPSNDPMAVLTWRNEKITIVQKVQFITQLLMVAAYGLIKLSIIYYYRRIFIVSKRSRFNLVTNLCTILTVAWTLAYIFAITFSCGTNWFAHWSSIYDILTYCNGGTPVQQIVESLFYTDLITDVLIITLPMPKIWLLRLRPMEKIAVTCVFLLGGVATGAAAARIYIFTSQVKRSLDPTLDENLSVSSVIYWSMIEAGLSLIAACLPTTQHILRGHSIGSVVASIRSVISLPSIIRSQNSGGSVGSRVFGKDSTVHGTDASGSSRRLAGSGSITDRNGVIDLEGADPSSGLQRHGSPGVTKAVSIEMTSHEQTHKHRTIENEW